MRRAHDVAAASIALGLLACRASAPAPAVGELTPAQREQIDAVFAQWDRANSPGCALGVIRDGELVYARGYGAANLEHGIPITTRTVFDIGSTSKQFTAACIGLLVQEGRLALGDDVRKLVPELPDYGKTITIEHLLHHTSGLRDYLTLFSLAGIATEDLTDGATALAMLARQKQINFDPGAEHLYSNSGYFLLSVIVERASGKSLPEFARERIFEPLGMHDTHFHDDHTLLVPLRATGYAPRPAEQGGGFGIDMSDFEQTGDGAVMTTVADLARWDANFYEPTVGGPALIEFLRTPGMLADGTPLDYCCGLFRGEHAGLAYESHGGAWAGYRADMLRFPSLHVSVICLANLGSIDPSALCWQTAAIVLGDELAPREREREGAPPRPTETPVAWSPTSAELGELAGDYDCEELGVSYSLELAGDTLTVGLPGREHLPLRPIARDEFGLMGARFRFQRDSAGQPRELLIDAGRVRGLRCTRSP